MINLPENLESALQTVRRAIAQRLGNDSEQSAAASAYDKLAELDYWLRKSLAP